MANILPNITVLVQYLVDALFVTECSATLGSVMGTVFNL